MSKNISDEVLLAKQSRKEPSILLLLKDRYVILVLNNSSQGMLPSIEFLDKSSKFQCKMGGDEAWDNVTILLVDVAVLQVQTY
jgi:hypothetical protein